MKNNEIKEIVRNGYAKIAKKGGSCCSGRSCSSDPSDAPGAISKNIGYNDEDLKAVPDGANLGLGCGNPVALASLKEGDRVLDLGSGAGFDCFLASRRVGKSGRVIGVDMTSEMVERARGNAVKGNYDNVEFRLGEIEDLPVEDNSIDVIISNCVINLSPDKNSVFREALRVLKPLGRLMVSDIVLLKPLPENVKNSIEAYVGCLAGAVLREEYIGYMKEAGFDNVEIISEAEFPIKNMAHDIHRSAESVVSIKVCATKGNE